MVPAQERETMSEVNEQIDEASGPHAPEQTHWIERLTEAVSDFESMGAEDAAGLGL